MEKYIFRIDLNVQNLRRYCLKQKLLIISVLQLNKSQCCKTSEINYKLINSIHWLWLQ